MKKTTRLFLVALLLVCVAIVVAVSCGKENGDDFGPQNAVNPITHQLGCRLLPQEQYLSISLKEASPELLKAAPTVLNLTVPPVADQGSEGSCVAFATAYAARSIAWQAAHPGAWSTGQNIFSPEYVYNQVKITDCASGTYVVTALALLQNQGVVPWEVMPYSDADGCGREPTIGQNVLAADYKIGGYSRISITAMAIKAQLVAGKPVVVAGPVNSAFMYLTGDRVLEKFTGRSLGGHCCCVVGYDDLRQAFKIQNSWGTTWGASGFGYVGYRYVDGWWQEAYVLD